MILPTLLDVAGSGDAGIVQRVTRPSPQSLDAWRGMLNAHAEVVARLAREMKAEIGIPLTWYEVLLILFESPDGSMRMHKLAEARLLSRSAATRLVDRMLKAGLVERAGAASDGRGTTVRMSADGEALLRRAGRVHLDGISRHFGDLIEEDEAAVIASVMWRVASGVRSAETE